jgi:hypothetical protein
MIQVCRQCGRDFNHTKHQARMLMGPPLLCPSCQRAEDEREQRAAEAYDDPDPIIDERSYP